MTTVCFQFLAVMQTMKSAASNIFCSEFYVISSAMTLIEVVFNLFWSIVTSDSAIFAAYLPAFSLLRALRAHGKLKGTFRRHLRCRACCNTIVFDSKFHENNRKNFQKKTSSGNKAICKKWRAGDIARSRVRASIRKLLIHIYSNNKILKNDMI